MSKMITYKEFTEAQETVKKFILQCKEISIKRKQSRERSKGTTKIDGFKCALENIKKHLNYQESQIRNGVYDNDLEFKEIIIESHEYERKNMNRLRKLIKKERDSHE